MRKLYLKHRYKLRPKTKIILGLIMMIIGGLIIINVMHFKVLALIIGLILVMSGIIIMK